MKPTFSVMLDKLRRGWPLGSYLSVMGLVTLLATAAYLQWGLQHGMGQLSLLLIALPTLITASNLGLGVTNWLVTRFVRPEWLPRMDFADGIPSEYRTLVAVPTMLTSATGVESLLEGLEVRYLANRDSSLHFALLTDLVDAPTE